MVSLVIVEERLLNVGETETSSPIDIAISLTIKRFFRGDDSSEWRARFNAYPNACLEW